MTLILLINLKKREDRFSRMQSRLKNLNFVTIEAVDGNNLDPSVREIISDLSQNEKACVASHIKALSFFLDSEEKGCIVLEDDVVFNDHFFSFLSSENEFPKDTMVIKLETFQIPVRLIKPCLKFSKFKLYELGSFHKGSAAYFVSRSGAKIILSELKKFILPNDNAIFESFLDCDFSKFIYQLDPPCCIQENVIFKTSDSDILESRIYKYKQEICQKTETENIIIFKIKRELFRICEKLKQISLAVKNIRRYRYSRLKFFK